MGTNEGVRARKGPVTKTVFETPWFSVQEIGTAEPYYRISAPDSVLVLPVTATGDVVLVRQFRPAVDATTLELPAGYVEDGEDTEFAARREVLEETGYGGGEFKQVSTGFLMASRLHSRMSLYLALGVQQQSPPAEDNVKPVVFTPSQLRRSVLDGGFAQPAGLGLLLLAGWKFGAPFGPAMLAE